MSAPFFSVIIPTYNRAGLIGKTIDSILAQSFGDYEIIVVDNKSTDNTVGLLQSYISNGSIRLYVQDKNYERARSRNKGFDEARGKFVTLLDSDDYFYPSCLKDAFDFHAANPGLNFFHGSYELVNEQGAVIGKGSLQKKINPFKSLATGNYISNIGVFINTGIAKEVRVDETPVLIGMEDYDFALRVLHRAGNIGFIPAINCAVLNHPGRTVLTQDMQKIEDRVRYFVDKTINGQLFTRQFAGYKKYFLSGNQLYLCGAAAIRGLSFRAFRYWLKAARQQGSLLFTIKYWKHFLVIIKYMFK